MLKNEFGDQIRVLTRREGCPEDMAQEIADKLAGRSHDVRDATRVSPAGPGFGSREGDKAIVRGVV